MDDAQAVIARLEAELAHRDDVIAALRDEKAHLASRAMRLVDEVHGLHTERAKLQRIIARFHEGRASP